jgi:hypothetical protein
MAIHGGSHAFHIDCMAFIPGVGELNMSYFSGGFTAIAEVIWL